MADIDVNTLRAEREQINQQINDLRVKASALSDKILELEGPIPDRSARAQQGRLGYTIAPSKE